MRWITARGERIAHPPLAVRLRSTAVVLTSEAVHACVSLASLLPLPEETCVKHCPPPNPTTVTTGANIGGGTRRGDTRARVWHYTWDGTQALRVEKVRGPPSGPAGQRAG